MADPDRARQSEWTEQRQPLPGGGSMWSRGRQVRLPGGLWWIEQHVLFRGRQVGPFPMGAGWIVECIELADGAITFRHDGRDLPVPWRRFVWLLPAFSVVHVDFQDAALRFVAVAASDLDAAAARTRVSRIFPFEPALPDDAQALLRSLRTLEDGLAVEGPAFPEKVQAAKHWLDLHYRERISIAALARSLGASHPHLTRQFRDSVGMSPRRYQHYLRASEAVARLAAGDDIIETSLEMGYGDLSRFYEQFRRLGCSSPGRYRRR